MTASEDIERLLPWIVLKNAAGIGNLMFKRLMDRFGDPGRALAASKSELGAVDGMTAPMVAAVRAAREPEGARQEIALARENGCRIVTMDDPEYPVLLKEISDPPPWLYIRGSLQAFETSIAIVGSRNPTRYGLTMARRLSADLAEMGFSIISGMARGIDTAAHQGALSAGGRTAAVLGSGLCVIYPPENRKLYNDIANNGAVVSEFPMNAPPNPYHFPARNRIISGMTLGTVVVEAAKKSGSLITARLALEQDREVFAVPGNINSFKSAGTHRLLKEGAKLVERAADIAEEVVHFLKQGMPPTANDTATSDTIEGAEKMNALTTDELKVYHALDPYPVHIDELGRRLGMATGLLSAILLNLELKGIVSQMPGKYFSSSGEQP